MSLWSTLGITALVIFVYMTLAFVLAVVRKRNDIADIVWGLGFIVVAVTSLLLNDNLTTRKILVLALVVIWGLRLAIHIAARNLGKGEDYRYRQWREDWGENWVIRSYLQVFLLQGLFMLVVTFPIMVVNTYDTGGLNILDIVGVIVYAVGLFFEAVGDYQLEEFKSDPNRSGILQSGLWRYTRHPNYFGEVTVWWGVFLIVLSAPNGWLGIIGPIAITILITQVSGIPMLEEHMEEKPGWEEYKRRTSIFFPLPPKS